MTEQGRLDPRMRESQGARGTPLGAEPVRINPPYGRPPAHALGVGGHRLTNMLLHHA